jgi:hypothetical protein
LILLAFACGPSACGPSGKDVKSPDARQGSTGAGGAEGEGRDEEVTPAAEDVEVPPAP